jgi:hypothetical protein
MRTQLVISAAAALLIGSGAAVAQKQTPREASPPAVSSHPETHPQSTTPDRPPATAMPDANKPSPGNDRPDSCRVREDGARNGYCGRSEDCARRREEVAAGTWVTA